MITCFGYGRSIKAIAKKYRCDIFSDEFREIRRDEFGNRLIPSKLFEAKKSSFEIVSPGISPNHFLIKKAVNPISDIEFLNIQNKLLPSIWVSGTNGKTTTTEMIEFIFDGLTVAGGNIGRAVASLDYKPFWTLEVSSFMLYYTKKAKPFLYLLLPIKEDHLDWHGSFENYKKAKLSVIKRMTQGEVAVIPKGFNIKSKALIFEYEDENDLAKQFGIDLRKIEFNRPFLLDALLALVSYKIVLGRVDYEKINRFRVDEHKMEKVVDSRGRIWINDSKATNPAATIECINAFKDKEIFLILGGDSKGVNLDKLLMELPKDIKLFLIGKDGKSLEKKAKDINLFAKYCNRIEDAVKEIDKIYTKKNQIAILSPACSSLDQFSSYKERGEIFKKLIGMIRN